MRGADLKQLEERVAELERSEQLLRALDQASAAMIGAVRPEDVIGAIGGKLLDLGLQTVVLQMKEDGLLGVAHLSMSSHLVGTIERRVGLNSKNFTIDPQRVDFYRQILAQRQTIYVHDTFEIASSVLPRLAAPLVRFVLQRLGMSQMIGAPLIVGEGVWGVFVISSKHLAAADVSAVRLFAHQVGWALHKTQLVSRLRETVATMEATQAQLVQSQKMEALGRLTGGIAHDLNNLLTGVLMSAALAKLDAPEGSAVFGELENIEQTSLRASDLISQLMAFSRRKATRISLVDLNAELEQLRPLLRRVVGEDIQLRIDLDASQACVCRIDRTQLEQVIINLVVNARDAMPSGGEIALSVGLRALVPEVADSGAMVCFSVQDAGEGIPEGIRSRLFDPFFTTKPRGQGTGLGLSVVYGILEQYGGRITVHSELGKGTRFDVLIPAATEDSRRGGLEEPEPEPEPEPHGLILPDDIGAILLVEDAAHLREVVERCLRRFDAQLQIASCVKQARAVAEAAAPDLIICDVVLPDGNGLDLCTSLYERHPDIAVVLVSGYTDRRVDLRVIDERGWVFLPKPFSTQQLLQALGRALARRDR